MRNDCNDAPADVRIAPKTLELWEADARQERDCVILAQRLITAIAHVRELRRELSRGRTGW